MANLRVVFITSVGLSLLAACGGGDGGGGASCSPAPSITSTPRTQATVGVRYVYAVEQRKFCVPFITNCGGVIGVVLPPNTVIDTRDVVLWTPSPADANRSVSFQIRTTPDPCGGSATQSWNVTSFLAPVISSFQVSQPEIAPGATVTLTAVFQGSGEIEGLGTISSGVPLVTPPLNLSTNFRLVVRNSAGAEARSIVSVAVLGPPLIQSFVASPSVIGQGGSSTLSWITSGDFSTAVIAPLGTNVRGATSLVVTPATTTTYDLQLSNTVGGFASASVQVQVQVIPPSTIQSFTALPTSTTKGGSALLSATFQGTGSIASEVNGVYSTIASIVSGGTLSTGALVRTTGFRLSVTNAVGAVITQDLTVAITGPGTFQPANGQPRQPTRFYHAATRLLDGRVFITGGGAGVIDTELFDPVTETFSAGPNLLAQRVRHSAALLPDGRVLIVGGGPFGSTTQTAEIYDPATNTMSAAGQLPSVDMFSPSGPALELMDGRVVVQTSIGTLPRQPGVVIFDPTTSTFGPFIPFAAPVAIDSVAPLPNGRGLFSRGQVASEIFFPDSNSFGTTGAVTSAHGVDFYTVSLLDGRVLLIGGSVDPATPPEIYDPSTGAFTPINQIFARRYGRAVRLSSGKILVAGGILDNAHPWAELYDPAANSITATGGLRIGRSLHTATLLQDGRVLIVGGCAALPCGAEIYTPE